MNNTEKSYNFEYPAPAVDPEVVRFNEEKKQLRGTCNTVGLMMLIAIAVFFTFSMIVAMIYYILLGTGTLPSHLDSIPENIIGGLANVAAIGICGIVFIKLSKMKMSDVLVFEKINARRLLAVVVIGFTGCMVANLLDNLFLSNTYSLGIDLYLDYESPVSNSFLEIVVYFIATAIVPAFSEEILFRGAVLGSLRKYGDAFAIFVSSALFGLFHANFEQIPFAFIVGLIDSWAVVYTNSMLPAIIIHAANNGFSVICDVIYTNADALGISETTVDSLYFIFVAIVAVLAIFAIIRISRNDKNFMKFKGYDGILDRKTRTKMLVTSPTIIISIVMLLAETLLNHIPI